MHTTDSHRSWRATRPAAVLVAAVALLTAAPMAVADDAPVRHDADHVGAPTGLTDVEQALDRFVGDQLRSTSIPGAALALTHDGQVVHVRGFGRDSDGTPVTADTLFRIASLSKSFTSLAVMQLVEQGRVSLDDRITDLLPEFHPVDPRATDITVAEVLNHTSGLADQAFNELSGHQPRTLAEAVARLNGTHLVADPGTEWNYHNPNYEIAARIVEVVSGQDFNAYLRERVLTPAGMTSSTSVNTDNGAVDGLVDGHIALFGRQMPVAAPDIFGAGAGEVVSTAADMAKWLVIQTNDGRSADGTQLVSTHSLTQMHTASTSTGYAYGWSVHRRSGEPTRIDHSGNLVTFSAYQALLPDSGYGVVLLFNSASVLGSDQSAIYHGVLDILSGSDMTPDGAQPTAATVDYVIGTLTIVVLVLGMRGVVNARSWSSRRATARRFGRTLTGLRLLPLLVVLGAAAMFPTLAEGVFGRAVTWTLAAYAWPAVLGLVLAAFASASVTLLVRIGVLLSREQPTRVG